MNLDNGWISIEACPNCGADNLAPYQHVQTAPFLTVSVFGGSLNVATITQYVICQDCRLVTQSPRVTNERLMEYYASGFYRNTLGITVDSMDADELQRSTEIAEWLKEKGCSPNSHLDIGCSRGYLLELVDAGLKQGFDYNPEYSRSVTVINDKSTLSQYDLVTAIHVLEHSTDPLADLYWYKSLSTDRVLIEVPGENCKGGPLRFAHLFYFPTDTLIAMVESVGMKVIEAEREPHTRILAHVT